MGATTSATTAAIPTPILPRRAAAVAHSSPAFPRRQNHRDLFVVVGCSKLRPRKCNGYSAARAGKLSTPAVASAGGRSIATSVKTNRSAQENSWAARARPLLNMLTRRRELPVKQAAFTIRLALHGSLTFFLRSNAGHRVERQLCEKSSVKDVIESCGVPHPEVDLILVDGQPVDFGFALSSAAAVDVYSVDWKRATFFPENRLNKHP